MQINGANNSYLARFLEGLSAAKPNTPQPGDTSGPDASLQTDYAWLTAPLREGDTDAVSRARQLIASGEIDESAAALIAAENILKLGI